MFDFILDDPSLQAAAIRYLAWAGLVGLGLLPLTWAVRQRFGGGLSSAMGRYHTRTRRGAPCKAKQCFLDNLDRDIKMADRVRRFRILYTVGYVAAVLAPGAALVVYALNYAYLAPGAAPPFTVAHGAPEPAPGEVIRFFFLSSNFLAMLAEQLVQDLPGGSQIVGGLLESSRIQVNAEASVFSGLATSFKWVSGPALLLSGVVIADLWGGFRHIGGVIERYQKAKKAVEEMRSDLQPDTYSRRIGKAVSAEG